MDNLNYPKNIKILIVDDDALVNLSLSEFLALEGYSILNASNGRQALDKLRNNHIDVVITDIKMPEMDGTQLLNAIKHDFPETYVIMVTGFGSIENAVEAIKQGAFDYITKPVIENEIRMVLERLIKQKELVAENLKLKEQIFTSTRDRFCNIVGKDIKMQKIYTLIEAICATRSTVLIHGESGTGKHLIAHAIHEFDETERSKPFVEVSCGALTETLLESELFGHVKGAFTGAVKDKVGRFELADKGTIFLDEIDTCTQNLQVKLLRVLQEGELERVGESNSFKVDVRVIAATNQNIQDLIAQGKFRKDLFYRLNIIAIELPPLRERKMDIPLLAQEFVIKHSARINKKVTGISDKAMSILMKYNWPGNIRELENVIERATIFAQGPVIFPEDFPEFFTNHKGRSDLNEDGQKLKEALKNPEKDLILKALESVEWNRNEAAKALGINRTTLYKKMVSYGLLKQKRAKVKKG